MRRPLMVALGLLALPATTPSTSLAIPQMLNYQGILLTSSGDTVRTSTSVEFAIWDAPSGGKDLWNETRFVLPDSSGRFNVLLGALTPIPDSAFAADAYLALTVESDNEMTPRQRIVAVGYAYRVGTVDGSTGGTITSKVSIGPNHTNTGADAFVAGNNNESNAQQSAIGGGQQNVIEDGEYGVISGGLGNILEDGKWTTIGGGSANHIEFDADGSTVGGGTGNLIDDEQRWSTIAGGILNWIQKPAGSSPSKAAADSSSGATIGGGKENIAVGSFSSISGGWNNQVSGDYAVVPGGRDNSAGGEGSFAAGTGARARHRGSFVWSDTDAESLATTGDNQFLIRASGGVGIGTNSPTDQLTVEGVIYARGGIRLADSSVIVNRTEISAGWEKDSSRVFLSNNADSVGIGTDSPSAKLEVAGVIYSSIGGIQFPDLTVQTTAAPGTVGLTELDAGAGLVGGGTSGTVSVEVGAGDGILVNPDDIAVNAIDVAGDGLVAIGNDLHVNPGPGLEINAGAIALTDGGVGSQQLSLDAVTSSHILDGTILGSDIGPNGATPGQILKWDGANWVASDDDAGTVSNGFFPSPEANSGWLSLPLDGDTIWTHNVGGDPDDYVVDVQQRDLDNGLGVNSQWFGGRDHYTGVVSEREGVYYSNLTATSITISRFGSDQVADMVRVRIWRIQ